MVIAHKAGNKSLAELFMSLCYVKHSHIAFCEHTHRKLVVSAPSEGTLFGPHSLKGDVCWIGCHIFKHTGVTLLLQRRTGAWNLQQCYERHCY